MICNPNLFDYNYLRSELENFVALYTQRPISNNNGGMNSSHLFPCYIYLKTKKPKFIVESGVFKGLGTWLFEQVLPESKIISIDIALGQRQYISDKVTYLDSDITNHDWNKLVSLDKNPDDVLFFIDDHTNAFERVKYFHKIGAKHLIFEDNYPINVGNCYSIKQIIDSKNSDLDQLNNFVKTYYEFPPIYIDNITRWGDEWSYPTQKPILEQHTESWQKDLFEEKQGYTWICYLKLMEIT